MTIFIDTPCHYVETAADVCGANVVRKADGAFFEVPPEAAHWMLWAHVHGDKDLPANAEAWIGQMVGDCDGALWTHPPEVLEALAAEFGYADARSVFHGSEIDHANWAAARAAEKFVREIEDEAHSEADAQNEREHAERNAAIEARWAAFQVLIDEALAREFGEPIPAGASA